jgi:hypothetical protein
LKEGKGIFRFAGCGSYNGDWKNNLFEGKGVRTYAVTGSITGAGHGHKKINAGNVCDYEWKADKRHGACRYTFFNGEVYACTFVDGVCGEFDARQAAVLAAPDAASAQASTGAGGASQYGRGQRAHLVADFTGASAPCPLLPGILHDLVMEGGISLLQGPSGAAAATTSAQPEFRQGWRWLRSWAVKDATTITNQDLKCLYDSAVAEGENSDALAALLSVLKDEVAAAL